MLFPKFHSSKNSGACLFQTGRCGKKDVWFSMPVTCRSQNATGPGHVGQVRRLTLRFRASNQWLETVPLRSFLLPCQMKKNLKEYVEHGFMCKIRNALLLHACTSCFVSSTIVSTAVASFDSRVNGRMSWRSSALLLFQFAFRWQVHIRLPVCVNLRPLFRELLLYACAPTDLFDKLCETIPGRQFHCASRDTCNFFANALFPMCVWNLRIGQF